MIVRRAAPGDFPVWAAMLARLHEPGPSAQEFLAEIPIWLALDQPMLCWLAVEEDGTALGMIDARLRNYAEGGPDGYVPYVEDLWVETQHRHRGVARALVQTVKDWSRERGYHWLGSDALFDNRDSHAFHAAIGFDEIERLVVFGMAL